MVRDALLVIENSEKLFRSLGRRKELEIRLKKLSRVSLDYLYREGHN